MVSTYVKKLIKGVIELSESNNWDEAIHEWCIIDCTEDETANSGCVCGKENIRYLYTVENIKNGNRLFPIGSSCIRKFKRDDLNEVISIKENMFRLYRAIRNNEYISLTSDFFTRKLLAALVADGAFVDNEYNKYDGYNDYLFLIDMFNKRDKDKITIKQQNKIKAIIVISIRPYLEGKLKNKIIN